MENPRPEKSSVVEEVREKLSAADAVLLTEYRGLSVAEMASLRSAMRPAGGEYKVYKNTLVRLAAQQLGLDLDSALTGPTALAFVGAKSDGSAGDIATVAKAVQDFAKTQPLLVLKGGVLGEKILTADEAKSLASLPTASEIFARLAGAINSQARGVASVVSGVHRSLGYVLQACIDAGVFAGDPPVAEVPEAVEPEAAVVEPEAVEAPAVDDAVAEAAVAEAADDSVVDDDEPSAEVVTDDAAEDVPAASAASDEATPAASAADEPAAAAAEESE